MPPGVTVYGTRHSASPLPPPGPQFTLGPVPPALPPPPPTKVTNTNDTSEGTLQLPEPDVSICDCCTSSLCTLRDPDHPQETILAVAACGRCRSAATATATSTKTSRGWSITRRSTITPRTAYAVRIGTATATTRLRTSNHTCSPPCERSIRSTSATILSRRRSATTATSTAVVLHRLLRPRYARVGARCTTRTALRTATRTARTRRSQQSASTTGCAGQRTKRRRSSCTTRRRSRPRAARANRYSHSTTRCHRTWHTKTSFSRAATATCTRCSSSAAACATTTDNIDIHQRYTRWHVERARCAEL